MKIILTKEVEIKADSKNAKWFEEKGYVIPRRIDKKGRSTIPRGSKITVKVEDLPDCSSAPVQYRCDDCGKINTVKYYTIKYRKNSQYLKTGETICSNCANKRMSGKNSSRYKHGESRYAEYRNNAKYRNLEFNLTVEEFKELVNQPCHYCGGYSSDWNENSRGNGIDRKDSSKGYIYDNCVPCCYICNKIKHIIPYEKFISHIRKIYDKTKNYEI